MCFKRILGSRVVNRKEPISSSVIHDFNDLADLENPIHLCNVTSCYFLEGEKRQLEICLQFEENPTVYTKTADDENIAKIFVKKLEKKKPRTLYNDLTKIQRK